MTPYDPKFDLLQQACALRRTAIARSGSFELDPETTVWLVTHAAWDEFMRSRDSLEGRVSVDNRTNHRTLMGAPIRITVNDQDGTPPLQLLMEPTRVAK